MKSFLEIIKQAVSLGASDLFVVSGQPLCCKVGKRIILLEEKPIMPPSSALFVNQAYELAGRDMTRFVEQGDDDFAISMPGLCRLRVSAYKQRGSLAAVVRLVSFTIPDATSLGIPQMVMSAAEVQKGLVLVSGPAGSGKSTTLACVIDRINKSRSGHIITLEDPIEFLYRNDKCIISQREVKIDTVDYITALRASLRQSPDVILLGEMRDFETIRTAMTAAETGHLVLSTLHTKGAGNTVDRIIDIFPGNQQQQIRVQLASLLQLVISQQLVPTTDGGITPVFEVMVVNNAIRNIIREAKIHQIDSIIATSAAEGMISMDMGLIALHREGRITKETAENFAMNPEQLLRRLSRAPQHL